MINKKLKNNFISHKACSEFHFIIFLVTTNNEKHYNNHLKIDKIKLTLVNYIDDIKGKTTDTILLHVLVFEALKKVQKVTFY